MLRSKYARYELDQSPFYCLKSKAKLAKLLQVSQTKLKALTCSEDLYNCELDTTVDKEKSRYLHKPKPKLKIVQKRIEDILKRIQLPNYIHAPGKRRSYISNAKSHVNADVIRSLDIQQYFYSTPSKRVYWFFDKRMKCSPDVAGILTKLLTFKEYLPTGSPSSPLLSYFAHIDMWEVINKIVQDANCTLTIYMDDVTVSGKHVSNNLIWQIKQQFHRYGLRDNRKKEKNYVGKKPREVTGVILKEGELKLPNRQHLKIHECRQSIRKETDPDRKARLIQSLKGLEAQARQIEKANNT